MNRDSGPAIATGAPELAGDWRVLVAAAILTLAALGAYWNSFNVPLLLDDNSSISGNPSIRHLGRMGDVLAPLTTGTTAGRPLLNLTFALNYAAGDRSVQGYHVVNLLIHVCAGLALLGIVRRTLLSPALRHRYGDAALPLATFAAVLWTLHPLQTEAVTYISQRAESLMGLFYLLTLYCFIRANVGRDRRIPPHQEGNPAGFGDPALQQPAIASGNRWLYLSVIACLCGMATKQVMVTAPVLVLVYDRAFVRGSFRAALANRRWYYVGLAVTWFWLGWLMHRSSLAAINVGFHERVGWLTYALTELRVVTDYLQLAFWPHPLVFDYGSEIFATGALAVVPYALIVAALLVGVVIVWRRSPRAGFLGCWFFLVLAPTSTVVPIADQPMAESRMYLPLAAVVVLVTLGVYTLGRRGAFVALGVMAAGLGVLSAERNHDYRSEVSIWEDTVTRQPYTSRGHGNLGMALAAVPGRLPDAIAHYEAALRLKPDYAEAHYNLANALAQLPGRMPDSVAHYEAALRLNPDYADAHNNFANALATMPGRLPDAIAHYEAALRLKPDYIDVHTNLAILLEKLPGRLPDAIAHYEAALRLMPDYAEAQNDLGIALAKMPGRLPDAVAHYEAALRLKPNFVEAQNNLGLALAKLPGRMSDAIAHFEAALRLKPDLVEVRINLAALYAQTGRREAAIEQLEIAARLNPASTAIRDNLAKLKARRGQ